MIKQLSGVCLAALALASCEQKLAATLYLRDIHQIIVATTPMETRVDIKIDILETGIEQECSKPSGKEIVELVGTFFEKASLLGCEKIAGSMNGRMTIKATTRMTLNAKQDASSKYLLEFELQRRPNEDEDPLFARFNPEHYEALQQKLKRLNMMAGIKLKDARLSLSINNDLGVDTAISFATGVFVDGQPMDLRQQYNLSSREEALIEFGDVKSAFLGQNGWAFVLGVKHQNQQTQSN